MTARLDHVGVAVSDLGRSRTFYARALAPLGIGLVMEIPPEATGDIGHAGFGVGAKPFFWIGGPSATPGRAHVAFAVETRAEVDAFHAAALAAGGTDNGAPGLRPHYHPSYYAAFVLDPDGSNVEAVCHARA